MAIVFLNASTLEQARQLLLAVRIAEEYQFDMRATTVQIAANETILRQLLDRVEKLEKEIGLLKIK